MAKKSTSKKTSKKTTKKKSTSKPKTVSYKETNATMRKVRKENRMPLAIVSLIVNIFIPGLGSIIGGKITEGAWQLILYFGSFIIGLILLLTVVGALGGIILMIAGPAIAWIWGIVTGVQLIQEAS